MTRRKPETLTTSGLESTAPLRSRVEYEAALRRQRALEDSFVQTREQGEEPSDEDLDVYAGLESLLREFEAREGMVEE